MLGIFIEQMMHFADCGATSKSKYDVLVNRKLYVWMGQRLS